MTAVTEIANDLFEVSSFVLSMPHLTYRVQFQGNTPRVVMREGCIGSEWDRHAIGAVQQALIMKNVAHASAR